MVSQGIHFEPESVREDVAEIAQTRLENLLVEEGRYSLNQRLQARNIDPEQFRSSIVDQIKEDLVQIYLDSRGVAKNETPERAAEKIKKSIQLKELEFQKAYDALLSDETAKSERQAWARALPIGTKLTRESGARLWNKSFKELRLFIDRLINAHGIEAGRKGVKSPYSRTVLHLPEK